MTARFGLRFAQQTARQPFASRTPFQFRQAFKRWQGTAANPAVEGAPAQQQSLFQRLWTSEVGIKTVHFWAPIMKWGVVLAGATDFLRPAEKLSLTQNAALMATGSIWTRWCFVIRPKNMLLAAVNFCLFLVGTIQCTRIFLYQSSQKGSETEALKAMEKDIVDSAKSVEKKAEAKL
ncbi:Mitochondrial pyruvate carrier 3 [Cladophialophora carrionii]|uniref:Mitochondrial pyruvate carrier n=1 Tax=Cladophialophora carrionii TaxID=86049 RepID=A0A1C1D2G8_9EURO|nr:Mitochondrial pyruvate carrier 3 [Cladophialophora carrionii]